MSSTVKTATSEPSELVRLVTQLDLSAKVRLLTGATMFTLPGEPLIGLAEIALSDGPIGVRGLKFTGGQLVSLFPNATMLAASWDSETAYEVGAMLAEEAIRQNIHVVLGPTINLHRTPLGGRLFEAYSEDPLLTGKLAAAYVRGLQDQGVGATPKHLIANESETERNTVNSVVDEATLRELYLLPFEIAVEEGKAWSIMAAYNDVNGVAATEQHHVNNEIVKGEWGWDGLIMSDWFATKTTVPSAAGGLDLVMPGPGGPWGEALVSAVQAGQLNEAVIDDHVLRLLKLAGRVGALGNPHPRPENLPTPDSAVRRGQLTKLAAQSITVLTNRDATLPLRRGTTVALIGRHAVDTIDMGGGSAQVNPPYQVSVAEGLTNLLGLDVTVTDGVEVRTRPPAAGLAAVVDPETGQPGARFTIYDADGAVMAERTGSAIAMIGLDDDLDSPAAWIAIRARVSLDGPVQVGTIGAGRWEVSIAGGAAQYWVSVPGKGPGADILNPPTRTVDEIMQAGDLIEGTVTLGPSSASGSDASEGASAASAGLFGVIARPTPPDPNEVIAEAAAAAQRADVAVVVVGLTEQQETEAVDKSTLHLPGRQDDLVRAVAAVARRTVVVVNAATPVIMPWIDAVDAVLWAGLPGQEGGHAVAAALLGDIEPAGRLVTTFPVEDGATSAWSVTPVDGDLPYNEGTFIGYRGHAAGRAAAPAFWFGHGLGYTAWKYSDARLVDVATPSPRVGVRLTNMGFRESREVVQVYLRPAEPDQPVRLVGWTGALVPAGGSVPVEVTTDPRMWRRWDTSANAWTSLAPGGELLLARGLGDVRATLPLS
jgi:beta-glucosidase